MATWPWVRRINPYHRDITAASAAWIESFKIFDPKAQATFNKGRFGLLASLAYPLATPEHFRVACDLMNLFFAFDELSDAGDEHAAQLLVDTMMDALRHPDRSRPCNEHILGSIAKQFWERVVKVASPTSQRHFIEAFGDYCQSVVRQARDRSSSHAHTVDSYLEVRRDNIGARPSFALLEMEMDLPDEVLSHPTVVNLTIWAIDMLLTGNDLCSYNVEQARGDDAYNIVTVIMVQYGLDIQGAIDWVACYQTDLIAKFTAQYENLPSWGPAVDGDLKRYVLGIANWVRADNCWSFEGGRYFGQDGPEIMHCRWVALLPKVADTQKVLAAGPHSRALSRLEIQPGFIVFAVVCVAFVVFGLVLVH
ncbi:terpenoid synthase [Cubamyces sp. BRFM 1775]|nr:terpenoid synthase [Cubamyces sp. BRFM 1775]